jgi:hypothetical protein
MGRKSKEKRVMTEEKPYHDMTDQDLLEKLLSLAHKESVRF